VSSPTDLDTALANWSCTTVKFSKYPSKPLENRASCEIVARQLVSPPASRESDWVVSMDRKAAWGICESPERK